MSKEKKNIKAEEGKVERPEKVHPWTTRAQEFRTKREAAWQVSNIAREPHTLYGGESRFVVKPLAGMASTAAAYPASYVVLSAPEPYRLFEAGVEELQKQLNRATAALENVAFQKAGYAVDQLYNIASKNKISITNAFSKMDSWSDVTSLIIVSLDDYAEDKIEQLFEAANKLSSELASPDFSWKYDITYFSEYLNMEKIFSDGFNIEHGQIATARKA